MDALILANLTLLCLAVLIAANALNTPHLKIYALIIVLLKLSSYDVLSLAGLANYSGSNELIGSLVVSLFSSWVMHILLFYSFILISLSRLFATLVKS